MAYFLRRVFNPTLFTLFCLIYFWVNGVSGLDRLPHIYEDEAWQTAPGYTFWSRDTFGTFGTEIFTGFFGMEKHYYGFMPLYPIIIGAGLHVFGLGLFQARFINLLLNLLTLALTFRLGGKLFSRWHGAIAVFVLVGWKIAVPLPYLHSGIPFADVSRIVRYDNLVPLFGLIALLLIIEKPTSARNVFLAGLSLGCATLGHVYGGFWLPVIVIILLLLGVQVNRKILGAGAGFIIVLLPYGLFVASGWQDFQKQNANYAGRFDIFEALFYRENLRAEPERYQPIVDAAKEDGGGIGARLWLTIGGISLLLSLWQAWRETDDANDVLIIALAILGGLFALLLQFKTFTYLTTIWPLFAILIAKGVLQAWKWKFKFTRPILIIAVLMAFYEGAGAYGQMRYLARHQMPYAEFTKRISACLPPDSQVMGMQHYWLGLAAENHPVSYQSILVPIFLSNPDYVEHPIGFTEAIAPNPPDVILIDETMYVFLSEAAAESHPYHELATQIWAYLHNGNIIGWRYDSTYGRMTIYQFGENIREAENPTPNCLTMGNTPPTIYESLNK